MNPFQSETGTFVGVDSMLNLALALPKIFAGIIFTKGYLIVVLVLVEGVSASDFASMLTVPSAFRVTSFAM